MFTRDGERRRKEDERLRGDNNTTSNGHSSIVSAAARSLRIRTSLNTSLAELLLSSSVNKEEGKMPSAEETTYLIEVMPDTTQDFLSRDVDLLVSQIKENLRLSTLKAKSSISHKSRPSPYRIPSRSWADPSSCEVCGMRNGSGQDHRHHIGHHHKRQTAREEDDPYELLQELLREGGLIKEAVKRLQANLDRLGNSEEEDEEDDERTTEYRRKPYFYDSEDDPLPPVYEPVEL